MQLKYPGHYVSASECSFESCEEHSNLTFASGIYHRWIFSIKAVEKEKNVQLPKEFWSQLCEALQSLATRESVVYSHGQSLDPVHSQTIWVLLIVDSSDLPGEHKPHSVTEMTWWNARMTIVFTWKPSVLMA